MPPATSPLRSRGVRDRERDGSHLRGEVRRSVGPHPVLRAVLAAILIVTGAIAGAVAAPQAAAAAEIGPGFQEPGKPLNHLGGYRTSDGTIAYCIEAGHPSPIGGITSDSGVSDQVNGLDSLQMLRLNSVLARHGSTADPRTAAAVAMAVWSIADAARYAAAGGDERALRRAPESERAAIRAMVADIRAEVARVERVVPHAELRLTIDDHDERRGYLEVDLHPDTATATVTLAGAEFASSDTENLADSMPSTRRVADGDTIAFLAIPRDDAMPFTLAASTDDVTITDIPSPRVRMYSTPNAQTLVAASAATDLVISASVTDDRDRRVPRLSTRAQTTAVVGRTVHDTAAVTGVPNAGAFVRFDGFLQPIGSVAPVCTEDSVVYRSTAAVRIERDGDALSEDFAVEAEHVGVVFWVATLTTAAGAVLDRGQCGDPAETSVVSAPPRLPVVGG